MDKVVVYYHKDSDTMDTWFGNPEDEAVCEPLIQMPRSNLLLPIY